MMPGSLRVLAAALALASLSLNGRPALAEAGDGGKQAGDVMVRLRGLVVAPQNSSSSISGIGGSVSAETTAVPEIDVSYFLTDRIAVEVIAATTQHRMTARSTALGQVDVGTVRLLPPTLTAQYHPWPTAAFSPYVGAGINYTWFYNARTPGSPVAKARYDDNFGAVLQIGIDYRVSGNWYANLDLKQVFLDTTASLNGGTILAKTSLNPLLIGVGFGYKF